MSIFLITSVIKYFTALCSLPGFHENCSMFLRQTMRRRMQLVNLSLMSVGNKQINPGLTYFALTVAEHNSINLPCTLSASSKAELQNVHRRWILLPIFGCFKYHSPLTTVWHLEQVVLFKLLEHASFDFHKLKHNKKTYVLWLNCEACIFNFK